MKNFFRQLFILMLLFVCTGCSVFMATQQPRKRNMSILNTGTQRSFVIAEFGQPISSEVKDKKLVDIFEFVQGFEKSTKVGRAIFHGTADVFSLGLWEILGTPAELAVNGKKLRVKVIYDKDELVESSEVSKQ